MTERILLIDDDMSTVQLVGLFLEQQGYTITASLSSEKGLLNAINDPPDLILLDIGMPGLDGYEVCKRLRETDSTKHLPIIMFTAAKNPDDRIRAFQAGADDFIEKPVHPTELVARVKAVLMRTARERESEQPVRRAKTFGLIGAKGGVGTTTVAINVAVVLAKMDAPEAKTVIMAEMHPGMSTARLALGLRTRAGLSSLLNQPAADLTGKVVSAELQEHTSGAQFLCGQTEPGEAELSPEHAKTITQHLQALGDHLVLDLGTGLSAAKIQVLSECYHIVVVIEPREACLYLAKALLDKMVDSLEIGRHQISLLLVNRGVAPTGITKKSIESELQHTLIGAIPAASELVAEGKVKDAVVSLHPNSAAAQQLEMTAKYLAQI